MQDSPLSPILYNLSTDHILDELTEDAITSHYMFSLVPNLAPLTIIGFVDYLVLIENNQKLALELSKIITKRFQQIGFSINPNKSTAIYIEQRKLNEDPFVFRNIEITTLLHGEAICYLGVNFSNEITFKPVQGLQNKIEKLASSPLLQTDQKFIVINTVICPGLTYPFQTTKLQKIPKKFLTDTDILIRSALKEIIQIPADIPNGMVYAERKNKSLGLFCAKWEAYLQHIKI